MKPIFEATLSEVVDLLAKKEITSSALTEAMIARMEATAGLGAYVYRDAEHALAQARESDARRQANQALGPLDGVPMGLKDIFATRDAPTTCASRMLSGFVAPYDAHVVTRLREAGVVFLGKLNMDEFAMGSSSENSCYGPVRNPWDATRTAGGSSGGCAAAVAAGSSFGTLGTDTGGSIRQPAAMTGIVGLKPTYGRVSRRGIVAYASSLDQPGPMARTTRDCALLLSTIAGHDPGDMTSSEAPVPDYLAALSGGIAGLRIGLPREYCAIAGLDPEVRQAFDQAVAKLKELGAQIVDVSLPMTGHGIATYYVLAPAEASSNLARYDGVRFGQRDTQAASLADMYTETRSKGFGPEVKRRIMLGTWLLSSGHYDAYYARAQKVRTLVRRDFEQVFEKVDVLVTPTTPAPAFVLGHKETDPFVKYLADVFTVSANLAGIPGISLPCGWSANKLPIGLQLLGKKFDEATLLRTAHTYEQATPWHTMRAPR